MEQLYDLELSDKLLCLYKQALKNKPDSQLHSAHENTKHLYGNEINLELYHGGLPNSLNAVTPGDYANLVLYFSQGIIGLEEIVNGIKIKPATFKIVK
jgi:hypothetical protein